MGGKRGRRVSAAQWGDLSGTSLRQQMLDALIFSSAAYEDSDAAIKTILTAKYDLPVGILEIVADYLPLKKSVIQPYLVGRGTCGEVVVAFRGTADIRDLVADLQFIHRRLSFAEGSAHLGFVERAASIDVDYFIALLQKGRSLIFTGHSLGGAVASLVALRVLEEATCAGFCPHMQQQCQVITFGAPLFANLGLADLINTKYRDLFHHVVSKHDLVPKILPLVAAGHRLVGLEPYHMQLLRIGRAGLELAEKFGHVPLAGVVRAIEAKVPPAMRTLVWGALRVLWPGEMEHQYAFAGHIVMLDRGEVAVERAVRLTKAEELNFWFRQLGFGLGFSRFGEHKIVSYYAGLGRGMRSKLLEYLNKGNAGMEEKAQLAKVILEGAQRQLSRADVEGSQLSLSERVVRTYRSSKAGRGKKRVLVEESCEEAGRGGGGCEGGDGIGGERRKEGGAEDRCGNSRRSAFSKCDGVSSQSCFCSSSEQRERHRMEALSEVLHLCECSGRQGVEGEGVGGGADSVERVEEDRGLGLRVEERSGARRKLRGKFTGTLSDKFMLLPNDDAAHDAEVVPAWPRRQSECTSCRALQLHTNAGMALESSKGGWFARKFHRLKVGMVVLSLASIAGQIRRGRMIDKVWMFFSAVRFVVFNPFF